MDVELLLGSALDLAVARLERMYATAVSETSLAALAGMGIVLAIEPAVLGYRQSSVYRLTHPTTTTRVDLFYYLGKVFGYYNLVILIFSLGLPAITTRLANAYLGFDVVERVDHPLIRGIIVLVVGDFIAYWTHWGRHAFGWWWEVHKLHHSAEEFNAITTARGHPLDIGAIVITNCVPLAILGGTIDDYVWLSLIMGIHAGLSHSMLPWTWGWFGKYVLVSPVYHRIHHSALPEHVDKNLASLFPVWDWMFGTAYRGAVVNAAVGVNDNHFHERGVVAGIVIGMRCSTRAALTSLRVGTLVRRRATTG